MVKNIMLQKITPVTTQVGIIWGRDAIYLDEVRKISASEYEISGSLNSALCSALSTEKSFVSYKITFRHVVYFNETDIDDCEIDNVSSFDVIENSTKIANLADKNSKNNTNLHHYVFRTYDVVFELIASQYEFEVFN